MSAKPAMNSLAQAMKDLLDERVRQVAWWGVEVGKPDAAFHLVLAEEVGEAARAVLAIDPDATPEDLDRLEALYGEVVQVAAVSIAWLEETSRCRVIADRRQLVLPVATTIFAGRYGVIIRYGGTVDYRPTSQAIEAETYGRQDTGNGSGQGWDERAFSAQVAEWAIAVAGETGASVAHPAGSLRRGVGG